MGKLFGVELEPALVLMLDGFLGGPRGASAVRAALQVAGEQGDRAMRAETALELAQAELRRREEGRGQPEGRRALTDPPKGHQWVTGVHGGVAGPAADGRLVCVTCTGARLGGAHHGPDQRAILAAECWTKNMTMPAPEHEGPEAARPWSWREAGWFPASGPGALIFGRADGRDLVANIPGGQPEGHEWGVFLHQGAKLEAVPACRTCTESTLELRALETCAGLLADLEG